ncbi:MAG: hypothetical protein ABI270_05890 [Nitrosospira sp.]
MSAHLLEIVRKRKIRATKILSGLEALPSIHRDTHAGDCRLTTSEP